ncbi:MAG TPA: mechanosensitive ion channel domain-containing protein [Rudaea sp.]|nr:mechanosensitive ion channel domain-containing protein [Rudaea sp.]
MQLTALIALAAAVTPAPQQRSVIAELVNDPLVLIALKIVGALTLVWIGMRIGRWMANIEHRVLLRAHVDQILAEFLRNLTYAAVLALILISALELAGFPMTSLFTVLGAAGLAIGLALKDSLAHIAAGVVLIVLRPFRVGDAVKIAGQDGVVEGVFIFQTRLHTYDNTDLVFMNGQVIAGPIINYSQRTTRRSDITLKLVHGADLGAMFAFAKEAVAADKRILKDPAPYIAIGDITEQGIVFVIQVWSTAADMGNVRGDLLVKFQRELPGKGVDFARLYPAAAPVSAQAR